MNSATSRCAGRRVEVLRRADLADRAVAQHDDAVGERQRLLLVVRDVDRRRAERLVDAADLRPHLEPQLRVEVGERLVHQHQRRLDDDGAGDGDALLLPARKLAGQLVLLTLQTDQRDGLVDPARRSPPCGTPRIIRPKPILLPHASCAETARSSGTPCRSRALPGAACRCAARRARCRRPSPAAARRCSSASSTCRSRTGRAGR